MSSYPSEETRYRLSRLLMPLNLILVGVFVVVVDLRFGVVTNGRLAAVDVLPDPVGYALAAAGFFVLLSRGQLEGASDLVATAVAVLYSGLASLGIAAIFFPVLNDMNQFGRVFFGIASGAALVAVCWIFRGVCRELGLGAQERIWNTAGLLSLLLLPIPLAGLVHPPGPGAAQLLTAIVLLGELAPVVAILVATLRLRSAARWAVPEPSRRDVL